ncbi:UNVERIFIED_CONTAM: hypothetical protein FKN15_039216 [Acipenser sinensis]
MRPPKRVPANPSFFALRIHSEATRPIVPEDNTDLNGSTADPQAPYESQGSLVHATCARSHCRLLLSYLWYVSRLPEQY